MNIELYINNQLCDIDSPEKLGITLKRVLIKPSELNLKDAQKSYDISLPATVRNNEIFNYANVEETQGKFRIYGDARLYVDGVLILDGKFRLSEITRDYYRGNLGVPAPLTVKDVFGETKMTENAPLWLPFKDFAASVNEVNEAANRGETTKCIFPYVLYGLLPKNLVGNDDASTDRDLWDESVNIRMQDMPPSINVINMLKHIFQTRGYGFSGTALSDPRLNKLYMSYKNDENYVQPWNYGDQMAIKIKGKWNNIEWITGNDTPNQFERQVHQTNVDGFTYYTTNLFDANRVKIEDGDIVDKASNVVVTQVEEKDKYVRNGYQVTIPVSGLYKVRLKSTINIPLINNERKSDQRGTMIEFVSGESLRKRGGDSGANGFNKNRYEIKLLRDWGTDDFGFSDARTNKRYYWNNLNQRKPKQRESNEDPVPQNSYFPKLGLTKSGKEREIMFVDPSENHNYVVGLAWGSPWHHESNSTDSADFNYLIGKNADNTPYGTVLVAKNGFSWNSGFGNANVSKIAIHNPEGYKKYGPVLSLENAKDVTILDLPSGNIRNNVYFDDNGILLPLSDTNQKSKVLSRKELDADSTYILAIPKNKGWKGSVRLYNSNNETVGSPQIVEAEINEEYNEYDEYILNIEDDYKYLSLEIMFDSPSDPASRYDISNTTRYKKMDEQGEMIGWRDTNMFKIEIKNSPESYARRGWYKGAAANNLWNGDGEVNAIVWFNAGEKVTLAVSSDHGTIVPGRRYWGWVYHNFDFELDITPFRTDEKWLKVDSSGTGIEVKDEEKMNWNDAITFPKDKIDLVKFLPNDVRTDEFIDNFCKAFNLNLTQKGITEFSLDLKQSKKAQHYEVIDLDKSATVLKVANESLGLPFGYSLGFTINDKEEGYEISGRDDGGGTYLTGATEGTPTEHKSSFSYNWFKTISKKEKDGRIIPIPLPVISDTEPWTDETPYVEAMGKRYWNLSQRFWYFDGLLNDLGASFHYGKDKEELKLAKVSNALPGMSILSYKDEDNSILDNYFSLVTDANSNYTIVESHLTPLEYSKIGDGARVRFNGDLYYVAEVDGYSPLGRKPAKLKLIRKLL